MPTSVSLAKINRDPLTQCRVQLDQDAIDQLSEAMRNKETIPPVHLFQDEDGYHVGDGFHRIAAAIDAGRKFISAIILSGTQEDAFVYNCKENGIPRGVPMRNADKRKAAEMAIRRWGDTKSDRQIADLILVSNRLVSTIRGELGEKSPALRSPAKNSPTVNGSQSEPPKTASTAQEPTSEPEATLPSPAVASPKEGAKAILENMRLTIGKVIRMADEANATKKYNSHLKRIHELLDDTLSSLELWTKKL